jgi:hypothetical protein
MLYGSTTFATLVRCDDEKQLHAKKRHSEEVGDRRACWIEAHKTRLDHLKRKFGITQIFSLNIVEKRLTDIGFYATINAS